VPAGLAKYVLRAVNQQKPASQAHRTTRGLPAGGRTGDAERRWRQSVRPAAGGGGGGSWGPADEEFYTAAGGRNNQLQHRSHWKKLDGSFTVPATHRARTSALRKLATKIDARMEPRGVETLCGKFDAVASTDVVWARLSKHQQWFPARVGQLSSLPDPGRSRNSL
jgi:hypothetical protein